MYRCQAKDNEWNRKGFTWGDLTFRQSITINFTRDCCKWIL